MTGNPWHDAHAAGRTGPGARVVIVNGSAVGKSDSMADKVTNEPVRFVGDENSPLSAVRKWVDRFVDRGCICPGCGNYARLWRRRIISTSVADLIRLVRLYQGEALHVKEFSTQRNGNFAALVFWGLIAPVHDDDRSKHRSGYWIPTEKGTQFARGEISVPSCVLTRDGEFKGHAGPLIDAVQALGKRFDYQALLRGEA